MANPPNILYPSILIPFLGKFGPKNLNCSFKLQFSTYSNM